MDDSFLPYLAAILARHRAPVAAPYGAEGLGEALEYAKQYIKDDGVEYPKASEAALAEIDAILAAASTQTEPAEGKWSYRDTEIAFYAFRYGLGRMSYAVGTIAGYIRDKWHRIDEKHRRLICQEIHEAMARDGAGMKCDIAEWQAVLDMEPPAPETAGTV